MGQEDETGGRSAVLKQSDRSSSTEPDRYEVERQQRIRRGDESVILIIELEFLGSYRMF